jgi:hypothetical protein
MLPPLSAAALLGQNLVGVLLRNEFGFAPILWPFGQSDPAPGNGECPRLKFTAQVCSSPSLQQPKSAAAQVCSSPSLQQPESAEAQVARCRTQRQRAGISFVPETYNESAAGHDWNGPNRSRVVGERLGATLDGANGQA